ncbi:transposase, partial [Clostridiales bacterium AF36-10]
MQVVSSYGAEIKNKNIPIRHTLSLYREAVRCLTEIYETVWTELSMIDQIKRRFNEA